MDSVKNKVEKYNPSFEEDKSIFPRLKSITYRESWSEVPTYSIFE